VERLAPEAIGKARQVYKGVSANVDFYSGIILRALNIPVQMYPVMFAIGRMPGWIAHWYEEHQQHGNKIHRPRQVFTGQVLRDYVPIDER